MDYYSSYAISPENREPIFPVNEKYQKALDVVRSRVPKDKTFMFDSIEFRPDKTYFATQAQNEEIFILIRRHWSTNLGWFFRNLFYSILPLVVIWIIGQFDFSIEFEFIKVANIISGLLVFYSFIITRVFLNFIDWYFDPYIVTSERVISYEFRPFFSYSIVEASLSNIEDIRQRSAGPLAGIFNYGDIRITTASRVGLLEFKKVPKPTIVRNIIFDLTKIFRKTRNVRTE